MFPIIYLTFFKNPSTYKGEKFLAIKLFLIGSEL